MDAIESTASSFSEWMTSYCYEPSTNEYVIKEDAEKEQLCVENWLKFGHQVAIRKVVRGFLALG
jgi:hypothetical protein